MQDSQELERQLGRLPLVICLVVGITTTIHLAGVSIFLDQFFNKLPTSEVSDRVWVISGGVVAIVICLTRLRNGKSFRTATVIQAALIAALLVGTILTTSIESNYGDMRGDYWMGFGSSYAALFLVSFLGFLFLVRKREKSAGSALLNFRASRFRWITPISIYCSWALFFVPILLKTTFQPRDRYHSAYVVNEQLGWLQGRPQLFETIGQYGNIIYAPTWLFSRLPVSNLDACFLYLTCLTFLFFATFFGLITVIFKPSGNLKAPFDSSTNRPFRNIRDLCFFFGTAMMLQGTPNSTNRNNGLLTNLVSSIPIRSFLPLLLIFILLLICSRISSKGQIARKVTLRKINALMLFFTLTCLTTAINNFEFGLVLSISVSLSMWIWIWRVDRRVVSGIQITLGAFLPLLFILVFLVEGSNGEPLGINWVGFSRGFGADGAYNIPIPNFGVHMLFIGWFGATLAIGISILFRFDCSTHRGRRTGLISLVMVNASIWGFASLAYFSGRSIVSGQLQLSLIPLSIVLVAWSALAFLKFDTVNEVETETFSFSPKEVRRSWIPLIFAPALLAASVVNLPNPIAGFESIKPTGAPSVQNSWRDEDLQGDLQELFRHYQISSSTPTYSQFGNLGKELLGIMPTGVLNSPLDTTISEVLRNADCKALLRSVRTAPQRLIAVDITALPMQGIKWLCPALSQVSGTFGRVALFSDR